MEEKILNFTETKEDELRRVRAALLNILEDTDEARKDAVRERNKTMAIIENLTDGIILLNNSNEVEIISPLVSEFFRKKESDIIDKNIIQLFGNEELKQLEALLINQGSKKINKVVKQEISIGRRMDIEVTTVFLEDVQEKGGVLIILHDVTRDKLVEKMKTEFVSIAAHQLRTPLSAIKWTLRMALDGDIGELNPEQKDLLEKTYVSNERMISLINDLLNVTRIEEGRFLYKQELANMEDIVSTVIENSKDLLEMKRMKLVFNKPGEPLPQVSVDKEKMELAVQNLLENAIKYTPEGAGGIIISLERNGSNIVFKIKDNGVGIPDTQNERIFTKFFRGDNVIRMETEGSGLGLYTTRNIVDAHKGKIWFESKEGEGTTFYFTIPIPNI